VIEKPQMCEINPGIWDGLSPDQMKKYYPAVWASFQDDPYAFRAPRAESYYDLSSEFCFIFPDSQMIGYFTDD
jgi:6-phosphofructo-2-kinase / fructose-2,6-biphosphatase 4